MALLETSVRGDRISADDWNSVKHALVRGFDLPRLRGTTSGYSSGSDPPTFPEKFMALQQEAIEPHGIVELDLDQNNYSALYVTFDTQEVTANGKEVQFYTRSRTTSTNSKITVEPVIPGRPYLLRYEGTAPAFGDKLEPKANSSAVEGNASGTFLAVTAPDTDTGLIWAVKLPGVGSSVNTEIGKLRTDQVVHPSGTWRLYDKWMLQTGGTPVVDPAGVTFNVYNGSGVDYELGLLYHIFEACSDDTQDKYIATPHELTDCEQDSEHGVATNSVKIGPDSTLTTSDQTVVLGDTASATNAADSIVLGYNADSTDIDNVIIGSGASSTDSETIVIGKGATITGVSSGHSIVIGHSSTASDSDVVAIGADINIAGDATIAIGTGAETEFRSVAIGWSAEAARDAIAIGYNATAGTGATLSGIAIGRDSTTGNFADSIVIGREATATAIDQCVIGSIDHTIDDFYLGGGVEVSGADVAPDVTLHATGVASGETDEAGANLILAGGIGTGNQQDVGGVILKGSPMAESSGTTQNALVEMVKYVAGKIQTSGTTTETIIQQTLDDNSVYHIEVRGVGRKTDGTEGASYCKTATVRKSSGTASFVGTSPVDVYSEEDDATWNLGMSLISNNIRARCTGGTGDTIDWVAYMTLTKVG